MVMYDKFNNFETTVKNTYDPLISFRGSTSFF
jgi:hypothetical protein